MEENLPAYTGPAYCVKCKAEKSLTASPVERNKTGRLMAKGKCSDCGTGLNRFLGKNYADKQ